MQTVEEAIKYAEDLRANNIVDMLSDDDTSSETIGLIIATLAGHADGGPFSAVMAACQHLWGESYGDGYTIMDVLSDYAEPGYRVSTHTNGAVVIGSWYRREDDLPETLGTILEDIGADIETYDEWTRCGECYRAIRTQSDSYMWRPSYLWSEDGPVCSDCVLTDPLTPDTLEIFNSIDTQYVNNPRSCLTIVNRSDMIDAGWTEYGESRETGWHPGQNADPIKVYQEIRAKYSDPTDDPNDPDTLPRVTFILDESSQFYTSWSAWIWAADIAGNER